MNKRAFQLAVSTMILLVLGVLILLGLVLALTGSFERLRDAIRGYSGSDIDNLNKLCQSQCNLDNSYGFCCEERDLGDEKITCLDDRLAVSCDIDCEGVCGGS